MKRLLLVLLLLTLTNIVEAQVSRSLSTTTCPGSGCTQFDLNGSGSIGLQVSGTFVGTLQFEQTVNGTTYVSVAMFPNSSTTSVTSTTTTGVWFGTVAGALRVQVRFSAYTSGTAVVTRVLAQAKSGSSSGSGGSGTVTNIATTSPITGGPITTTGTIACATCGVTSSGLNQFASTTSSQLAGVISDETGSGSLVFGTAPTITLANGTGLPISTGVSGLGTGVATFLATPSSANLASALTDETGTGSAVFSIAPTFASGTITTSAPINVTQTWNNAGVNFYGVVIDITKTFSNSNSRPFSVQNGGSDAVFVNNQFQLQSNNDIITNTNLQFGDANYTQTPTRAYFHTPVTREFSIGSNGSAGKEYTIVVGSAPSCTGCGSSPTIDATNSVGRITLGTSPNATTLIITFTETMPVAPHCDGTNETTGGVGANLTVVPTTTQVTLTGTFTASDAISWHCITWR